MAHTKEKQQKAKPSPSLFEESKITGLNFTHKENQYNDFERQVLLPHKLSNFGPALAVGDVNKDGLEDVYLGGASAQSGSLFLQKKDGSFTKSNGSVWEKDKDFEDTSAAFFDADSDGDNDLYIVSGGNEFEAQAANYQDRLYINDGQGNFKKGNNNLPKIVSSGSKVYPYDYDQDGHTDLLITGRHVPGNYPTPANSMLLKNNEGKFTDVTKEVAPELTGIGMVTDATWCDYNGDSQIDLVLLGEWMPITFLEQKEGVFSKNTMPIQDKESIGWWFSIASEDIDNDGDIDLIAGNLGLNYKYKATSHSPFEIYYDDFDQNGQKDIALGFYENGKMYPLRGRECSSQQVPQIKKSFPSYSAFATATFQEVYPINKNKDMLHYTANTFASSYLENNGDGTFTIKPLPTMAQISSVNDILIDDFDKDGYKDLLIAGNLYASEVETPRNDAGTGLYLKGNGDGTFEPIPVHQSGLYLGNDSKNLAFLNNNQGKYIIVANNNNSLESIKIFDKKDAILQ